MCICVCDCYTNIWVYLQKKTHVFLAFYLLQPISHESNYFYYRYNVICDNSFTDL